MNKCIQIQNEAKLASHYPATSSMASGVTKDSPYYRDLACVPQISFGFVEEYVTEKSKSSGESHISKGYKYFSEAFIHSIRDECTVPSP